MEISFWFYNIIIERFVWILYKFMFSRKHNLTIRTLCKSLSESLIESFIDSSQLVFCLFGSISSLFVFYQIHFLGREIQYVRRFLRKQTGIERSVNWTWWNVLRRFTIQEKSRSLHRSLPYQACTKNHKVPVTSERFVVVLWWQRWFFTGKARFTPWNLTDFHQIRRIILPQFQ